MMSVQTGTGDPVVTHYLLDGQSVAQEMRDPDDDGSLYNTVDSHLVLEPGAVVATYLNGPRGVEYRQDASGVRSWYLYDGLGSVIAEVDEGNNQSGYPRVTSTHASDVYGNTLTGSSPEHGFVGGLGHVTDNDTGLMYMRARYYDPAIGRFASEDPAGDGANWYCYCNNNSVNLVDQNGRNPAAIAAVVIAVAIGALLTAAFAVGFYICYSDEFKMRGGKIDPNKPLGTTLVEYVSVAVLSGVIVSALTELAVALLPVVGGLGVAVCTVLAVAAGEIMGCLVADFDTPADP